MIFSFEKHSDNDNKYEDDTVEESLVKEFCKDNPNYDYGYFDKPPLDSIPVGSVEWCQNVYGDIVPDYYPDFLSSYFYRKIWKTSGFVDYKRFKIDGLFIKPADNYKSWDGHLFSEEDKNINYGEVWCSEVVDFINEWRYYVVDGKVVCSAWYDGKISDADVLAGLAKPPQDLGKDLLNKLEKGKYCGCIDMGEIELDGDLLLVLVEACHPFAVGWYQEPPDAECYCNFLISGYKYMKNIEI